VFRHLAEQKESRVLEGRLMPDHVHMLLSIPPKDAVSEVVGYIKGKSAIHLAWAYGGDFGDKSNDDNFNTNGLVLPDGTH
jgi:REP element-mobilizing transposase RayT